MRILELLLFLEKQYFSCHFMKIFSGATQHCFLFECPVYYILYVPRYIFILHYGSKTVFELFKPFNFSYLRNGERCRLYSVVFIK